MSWRSPKPAVNAGGNVPARPLCPICRSNQVSTTSKSVNELTYWRCQACGEIWNQTRLVTFKGRRW
jgi:transposase-like protein